MPSAVRDPGCGQGLALGHQSFGRAALALPAGEVGGQQGDDVPAHAIGGAKRLLQRSQRAG